MSRQIIRVLVVDDDFLQVMSVKNSFGNYAQDLNDSCDIFIDTANCVDGAICLINGSVNKYDFIITDIEMPRKNGFDLICFLKDINYPAKIIANSCESHYKDKCMDLGCYCFMDKFDDFENLFNIICSVFV